MTSDYIGGSVLAASILPATGWLLLTRDINPVILGLFLVVAVFSFVYSAFNFIRYVSSLGKI